MKKKYHIVHYVQNCTPKNKKFTSIKKLTKFINEYKVTEDNWVDFCITNIYGDFIPVDEFVCIEGENIE